MYVGQSIAMRDAIERVSGQLMFTLNFTPPNMAHAKVLRCPFPHALIHGVDASEALSLPGVITVVTGRDLIDELDVFPYYGQRRKDQPIVAIEKARYAGDPVAIVVAETEEAADEALLYIDVDYEELPFITDAEEAPKPGAPVIHDDWPDNVAGAGKLRHGDIEQGWRESDRIYEHVFHSPTANHVPMEPHVSVAEFGDDGVVNVWTSTQAPYAVQGSIVDMLKTTADMVRVHTFNLGGGYGAKGGTKLEPLAVAAAMKAKRPVRLALSREEVFLTTAKHAARVWIKSGVKNDGTLVARHVDIVWNSGAYAVSSPRASLQGMVRSPGPYRIPHVWADSHAYYTNTVPTGPFRGAMTSQVCWAYESHMDEIAADIGMDPVEFRRKNLMRNGDTFATGEELEDLFFVDLLDNVAEAIEWDSSSGADSTSGQNGHLKRGKGVGILIKHTITPSRSEADLEYRDNGDCTILSSSVEMGQGPATSLHQYVADQLGIPLERISAPFPDTHVTPYDLTTSSSRTAYSMSFALREAATDLKRQLAELAADLWEANPDDISVGDGKVSAVDRPDQILSYEDLLKQAGTSMVSAHGVFQSPEGYGQLDENGQGLATVHWHQGAAAVEVEVDTQTGRVRILNCHGASYAGRMLNPTIVRQQNEGNIIYGLGPAMFEEYVLDQGELVNPNLSDYMIPSVLDIPERLTSFAIENPDPDADVHGVGEMTVPAIAPAIRNAIFHATGARIYDLPMSAERVYRAVHAVDSTSG